MICFCNLQIFQEVAIKRFLDQDIYGESLEEFKSEVIYLLLSVTSSTFYTMHFLECYSKLPCSHNKISTYLASLKVKCHVCLLQKFKFKMLRLISLHYVAPASNNTILMQTWNRGHIWKMDLGKKLQPSVLFPSLFSVLSLLR